MDRRLEVLIVEDDEVSALIGGNYIERAGHRAERVPSGEAALAALSAANFDLVLMDIEMDGIDGFETARRIRGGEAGYDAARLPIIAMTAHTESQVQAAIRESGMSGYIAKPVKAEEVGRLIEDTIRAMAEPTNESGDRGSLSPAAAIEEPVLDLESALERLGGDGELLEEVLAAFLGEAEGKRQGIAAAIAAADRERLRRLAHSVRGGALTIGAEGLALAAQGLEAAVLAGDVANFVDLASRVNLAYMKLEEFASRLGDAGNPALPDNSPR